MRTRTLVLLALLGICILVMPGCLAMRVIPLSADTNRPPGPGIEVVRFPTTDGLTLEGRLYPARADRPPRKGGSDDRHKYPRLSAEYERSIIIHHHGVADNNTSAMASFFSDAGFRVFQFDYRGFGASDRGRPSGRAFADDARAALEYVRSRDDVDPEKIILYGHSMGGVYAMASGAQAEAEGRPVRAVITACTFSSWRRIGHHHLPVVGYLLGGVDGPTPRQFASRLGRTALLITHTGDDVDVPATEALELFKAARSAGVPTFLHIHPYGGHVFPAWGAPELEKVIVDFALHALVTDLRTPPSTSLFDFSEILRHVQYTPDLDDGEAGDERAPDTLPEER